jgi:hypothetical protein
MTRGTALLYFAAFLFAAHSCQRANLENVTATQIAERLLSNGGQPYGCTVHSLTKHLYDAPSTLSSLKVSGDMLHSSAWVGCDLFDWDYGGHFIDRILEKRAKGLVHSFRMEAGEEWNETMEWDCGDFSGRNAPIMGVGIYTPGGWDLCSQAGGLIKSCPPSRIEIVNSQFHLFWDSVPSELRSGVYPQFNFGYYDVESEIESIKLGIDYTLGVPTSFEVLLKNGESVSTSYQNFEFLGDTYPARVRELRSKINVPAFVKCLCDGEIYQVQVKLPGRPLVRLK